MGGKLTLTRALQSDRMRYIMVDERNRVLVGLLLVISPILLTTVYLYVSDLWPLWWEITDIPAAIIIIAVGIAGVCLLPIAASWRVMISAGYAVCTAWVLFWWAISFRGGL
jgi:hypothetical protein